MDRKPLAAPHDGSAQHLLGLLSQEKKGNGLRDRVGKTPWRSSLIISKHCTLDTEGNKGQKYINEGRKEQKKCVAYLWSSQVR